MTKNIIFGFLAVLFMYVCYTFVVVHKNEHFIVIRYFDNDNENIQFAIKIKERQGNCVTFINEFEMEQTICAENISITKVK
jgi:hypothetical protein